LRQNTTNGQPATASSSVKGCKGSTAKRAHVTLVGLVVARLRETSDSLGAGLGMSFVTEPRSLMGQNRKAIITVLLVDDDEPFREVLGELLRYEGWRVMFAQDGAEALHVLTAVTPDLIITDLAFSEMTDAQFIGALKADGRLRHIPLTLLSAAPGLVPSPVQCIMQKPEFFRDLLGRVNELVALAETIPHSSSSPALSA
jgi:hypothetical protein